MLSEGSGFTSEDLERARAYHRPRRVALVVDLALAVVTLALLTRLELPLRWWLAALLMPVLVELVVTAARLPVSWWRHRHDRDWGLTVQRTRGWAADAAKGAAVGTTLTSVALALLFVAAHLFPRAWPFLAAAGAAGLVLLLGFVAPVVLEPVFNHFRPLEDAALAGRLHALAEQAGTPVREILVADASRRTTRQNAYVSGIGATRRVVLWDTLLSAPGDEIAVVLAHELGHRVRRHVAALTALEMVGAAAFVGVLRLVRPQPAPRDTALVLLLGLGLELAALPLASALSRRFERAADRFSLTLTDDRAAFERLHVRLGRSNLTDLEPPKWLYYWLSSHPTPLQRVRDAEMTPLDA